MPEESRYIVLPVSLNTEHVEALLDSGVRATAFDRALASKLGLRPKGNVTAVGVTGLAVGIRTEGLPISIGNMIVTVPEATVIDLTPVNIATTRPIVAILGHDVFDPLVVDIDFECKRIAFFDPNVSVAPPGATHMPLIKGELGRRGIPISVEGQQPIPAILDLGSDAPLCLSPDYVGRFKLFRGRKTSTSLSVGVEGVQESQVAVTDTTVIGPARLRNVPAEVPRRWTQDFPAVLGMPVLSRFRLMIDFGRNLIWMLPYQDAATRSFKKDRLGFAAIPATDCLRVVHISRNSPAALAGLTVGDEIVAVDGQKVDGQYLKNRPRQGMRPAGTIVQFFLRNGSKMTVKLADYF